MSKNNNEEKEKVVTPELTQSELDNMAKKAGYEINNEFKKIRIKIPKDPLNKDDHTIPVCINGYIWNIKRGETVEVPEVVADVLENAGYI